MRRRRVLSGPDNIILRYAPLPPPASASLGGREEGGDTLFLIGTMHLRVHCLMGNTFSMMYVRMYIDELIEEQVDDIYEGEGKGV